MHNWCLELWGDYACFTRPEMKVERVSYDVITPSAARGIFEAILWKPAMRWNITRIEVLNPIQWAAVRRNEVGKTVPNPTARQMSGMSSSPMGFFVEDYRQQRAGLFLKDVRYRVHGYFDIVASEGKLEVGQKETEAKYASMFERRAAKGQCFHRPYLGCREFACHFRLVDTQTELEEPIYQTRDLGFMLYDMDFSVNARNPTPLFFRAHMSNGIVNTDRRQVEVRG